MIEWILEKKYEKIKNLKKLTTSRKKKKVLDVIKSIKDKPIIAEIKRRSPSEGILAEKVDVVKHAKMYEDFGAGAISILTDSEFFSGSFVDLEKVSVNVEIPVLCKDFILSEVQIENAYLSGADFILIVVPVLEKRRIKDLTKVADELNLKILYEIHEIDDLKKIKDLEIELMGVNCRNFHTMKVDIEKGISLMKKLNGDFLKVAESGIHKKEHIKRFKDAGADAFLIGTAFMKCENLKEKFKEFYSCL